MSDWIDELIAIEFALRRALVTIEPIQVDRSLVEWKANLELRLGDLWAAAGHVRAALQSIQREGVTA